MQNDQKQQLSMINECANKICHADFDSAFKELSSHIKSNKKRFVLENFIRVIGQPFYVGLEFPATEDDRNKLHLCLLYLNLAVTHAPYGNLCKDIIVVQPRCCIQEESLLKKLSVLSDIFKIKFYSELKENRIRFEKASLLCETIYQFAPVSLYGMKAEGTYNDLIKENISDKNLIDFMLKQE